MKVILPFARLVALLVLVAPVSALPQVGTVPTGLTPIFDGRTTTGWHWSHSAHHGMTAEAVVDDGVLILKPHPFGQGGIFLTDKTYKDFDLYLEANPDPGYNSGIFLRSSEGGSAYQIELVRPGNTGALLGEGMPMSQPTYVGPRVDINTVWKDGQWNSMRVLMVGAAPHITLWINDVKMWEAQLPTNDQIAGLYGGMIGLQLHWTAPYSDATGARGGPAGPAQSQRFRNIAIRELN
jgi:hypothetical protein